MPYTGISPSNQPSQVGMAGRAVAATGTSTAPLIIKPFNLKETASGRFFASYVGEPGDYWRKRLHIFWPHHEVGDAVALAQVLYLLDYLFDAADHP